jgi:hypothetical protein
MLRWVAASDLSGRLCTGACQQIFGRSHGLVRHPADRIRFATRLFAMWDHCPAQPTEDFMKIFIPTLCAAVLALSPVAVGSATAASPMTLALTTGHTGASPLEDLVQVQSRRYPVDRRGAQRHGYHRPGFDQRGRRPQPHRPPVRQQSRSGPDLGSAIVGAIVGGIIVNQFQQSGQYPHQGTQRGSYLSRSHIDWCHNRWRSYRVSDNSYQPYNGPRRMCVSPFGPS